MKLHQSRASYARGADPLPWIFTIAHRTFLDVARRRKRSRERLAPDSSFLELTVSSEVPPEDDDSPYGPELISAVLDALHKLPDNQREALLLTKIQGMSVTDAAALLGTTPGALKLRAHRAYVALRETFKPR
jgi:RNA polymerase sigma-70 factor (ECF subfamily)